jgi:hypothetical protein
MDFGPDRNAPEPMPMNTRVKEGVRAHHARKGRGWWPIVMNSTAMKCTRIGEKRCNSGADPGFQATEGTLKKIAHDLKTRAVAGADSGGRAHPARAPPKIGKNMICLA